ncbi:MAG: HNH endonuclease [Ruminococcus sp.]|nr:HNH endonuclease [Ruminococcus sp.]
MSFKDLQSFYRSDEWEQFRDVIIHERTSGDGILYCEYSGKPITKKYDAILHHKIELTEENVNDYNISLNPDNVIVVSFASHNKIHIRNKGFKQQVYLVYGSPCAGKTTWVNSVATEDDLIVDMDKIWECISASDRYHKSNRLKSNVFGIRDTLLEQIKTRTGKWVNAYIIGGYPLKTDRDRLCDLLRAIPIFIDESKEVCISRAPNENWKEYIEVWFDDYVE